MRRSIRVYLLETGKVPRNADLRTALARLNTKKILEVERAYPVLERAFQALSPGQRLVQRGIRIRYNYARALSDLCLKAGYDSCGEAATLCSALLVDREAASSAFIAESITEKMLRDCIAIESIPSVEQQTRIERELVRARKTIATRTSSDRVAAAADELIQLINELSQNETLTTRHPEAALHRDAGIGYVRAAERIRSGRGATVELARQEELYTYGIAELREAQSLGDTSRRTTTDISYAEGRLDAVRDSRAQDR